ncbi:MAG TPA: hypothetical protein V6C86_03280 [Oculatellaceae cyanobacterium]
MSWLRRIHRLDRVQQLAPMRRPRQIHRHGRRRGSIAFGAALAFALVVLGLGFVAFVMFMGAQNETRNAIDAGALNLGRQVLDNVSVQISSAPEQQFFNDVTQNGNGVVNLRNINRVWGKALFVAINSDGAGQYAGDTTSSVQSALEGAQEISDALSAKLCNAANLTNFFTRFADANSVRMIDTKAQVAVISGAGWQTSLMDRNDESNLQIMNNLPIGYNLNQAYQTPCTRSVKPAGSSGMNFLRGYLPLNVAGKTFWQVPFQFDEKPHLVSSSNFSSNTLSASPLPAPNWTTAVPNAFSVHGQASKSGGAGEQAKSFVQTNPRQVFPLQFPNGYVRIVLKQNTIQWHIDAIPVDSSTYEFSAGNDAFSGDGVPYPFIPICASGSGDCSVGNEYVPQTLLFAICGNSPPNMTGDFMNYILQRCKEMVPNCTMTQLQTALAACPISSDDSDQSFYVYPVNGTTIVAMPDNMAQLPSGCDKSQGPEGQSQGMATDGPSPIPNTNTETWTCEGVPTDIPWISTLTIERSWKPGTGYQGGCLGELTVHHTTDAEVDTLGCSCP